MKRYAVAQDDPRVGRTFWQGPGRGIAALFCSWGAAADAATFPSWTAARVAFVNTYGRGSFAQRSCKVVAL